MRIYKISRRPEKVNRQGAALHHGASPLTVIRNKLPFAAATAAFVWALTSTTDAIAAIGSNTQVFDDLSSVMSTFNSSAIAVVRGIGIASIIVIAAVMMFSGRPQFRLVVGAGVGLLMAALAKPIVGFLLGGG